MARTPKARALGDALRRARKDKGMLLRELAAAIERDMGVLSRWETGERTPKPEQVAQILTMLDVNGQRYDEIMTLAYGTDESQWVAISLPEQRQQMAAYLDWEQNATQIVEVAPLLVPGLLQTSDYIKAIMTAGGVPTGEIASRVTTRIGRRDVITKQEPAELVVLLGQHAFEQGIGGTPVMLAQVRHLEDMVCRGNIHLQIVPANRGWHPGLENAFTLIKSDRATAGSDAAKRVSSSTDSVVFFGTRRSVLMLHQDADVEAFQEAIDRIKKIALSRGASVGFLAEVANRMERQH